MECSLENFSSRSSQIQRLAVVSSDSTDLIPSCSKDVESRIVFPTGLISITVWSVHRGIAQVDSNYIYLTVMCVKEELFDSLFDGQGKRSFVPYFSVRCLCSFFHDFIRIPQGFQTRVMFEFCSGKKRIFSLRLSLQPDTQSDLGWQLGLQECVLLLLLSCCSCLSLCTRGPIHAPSFLHNVVTGEWLETASRVQHQLQKQSERERTGEQKQIFSSLFCSRTQCDRTHTHTHSLRSIHSMRYFWCSGENWWKIPSRGTESCFRQAKICLYQNRTERKERSEEDVRKREKERQEKQQQDE